MIAEFCKVLLTLYYIGHLSCQRQLTTKWKLGLKHGTTHNDSQRPTTTHNDPTTTQNQPQRPKTSHNDPQPATTTHNDPQVHNNPTTTTFCVPIIGHHQYFHSYSRYRENEGVEKSIGKISAYASGSLAFSRQF
jgi:hypothetical protein